MLARILSIGPEAALPLQQIPAGVNMEQSGSKGFISACGGDGRSFPERVRVLDSPFVGLRRDLGRALRTLTRKRLRVSYFARPSFGILPV